jgi:hypothetical protein
VREDLDNYFEDIEKQLCPGGCTPLLIEKSIAVAQEKDA